MIYPISALAAYVSWFMRNGGEDPPTFVADWRWRFEVKFPLWSRFLDCIWCTAPYAALVTGIWAAAMKLIRVREIPLVIGLTLMMGALTEGFLQISSFFANLVAEVETDEEDAVDDGEDFGVDLGQFFE